MASPSSAIALLYASRCLCKVTSLSTSGTSDSEMLRILWIVLLIHKWKLAWHVFTFYVHLLLLCCDAICSWSLPFFGCLFSSFFFSCWSISESKSSRLKECTAQYDFIIVRHGWLHLGHKCLFCFSSHSMMSLSETCAGIFERFLVIPQHL